MRGSLTFLAAVGFLAFAATAQAGAPAFQWTPAQAAVKVGEASGVAPWGLERTGVACAGRGKSVGGRFVAFRCGFTYRTRGLEPTTESVRVWLRVRNAGNGAACMSTVSMAAVPKGCLRARAALGGVQDPGEPLRGAIQNRINPGVGGLFQGLSRMECVGLDGWYRCSFGTDKFDGSAVVIYVRRGPLVRFTSFKVAA